VNFLERILDISPDGGSGSVELLLLLTPAVTVLVALAPKIHAVLRQRPR
jgi:hypothetical protein